MAKILIIEDDAVLSRMYQRLISSGENTVEVAYDGEEGLEKAKTGKPNFILLDIMLPKLNGIEVLEKLKSDPTTKQIPVVMLSNLSEEEKEEEAMAKGAVKSIRKANSDPLQIGKMINEILRNNPPKDVSQKKEA